jgi:hypothetical protein
MISENGFLFVVWLWYNVGGSCTYGGFLQLGIESADR